MKKACVMTVVTALGLCAARAIEIPLTYVRHTETHSHRAFQPSGYNIVSMKHHPPPGDWNLPPLIGPRPLYGVAYMGKEQRLFVLDRQDEDDVFYNRLHFDENGNKDLTDDPVRVGKVQHRRDRDHYGVSFPAVDMHMEYGDRQVPYSFAASMSVFGLADLEKISDEERERRMWLMLRSNCHYEGDLVLDGKTYRMALGDANCNGRFDDRVILQRTGRYVHGSEDRLMHGRSDLFYLTEGDGHSPHEWHNLGNYLALDDLLFEVNLDIPAGLMKLEKRTDDLVLVRFGNEAEQLTLVDREAGHCVMARKPGEQMRVPKGSYRLVAYRLLREDEWGGRWVARGEGHEEMDFTPVDGDSEVLLPFGEPLMGTVLPRPSRQGSTSYRLSLMLKGAGGERIGEVVHLSGSRTQIPLSSSQRNYPKEPSYQIVGSDGEVVARGTFEYG